MEYKEFEISGTYTAEPRYREYRDLVPVIDVGLIRIVQTRRYLHKGQGVIKEDCREMLRELQVLNVPVENINAILLKLTAHSFHSCLIQMFLQ